MDGMILPRTQLEQGVTEPPFHPNCRCTTVPYDEDWDYKGQRIAKDKDGKYYYVPETITYEEWKREFVESEKESGGKGSQIKDYAAWSEKREEQAKRAYEHARNNNDVQTVAVVANMSKDDVEKIYRYIFKDEHILSNGEVNKFDADYDMAVAWKRLSEGTPKDRDIILLKHELLEIEISKNQNILPHEAHKIANKTYNWEMLLAEETEGDGENDGLL